MTFVTMEELGNYVQTVGITPQILSQANSIVESIVTGKQIGRAHV